MGKYLNVIIAIVILVIVTVVCSTFFYKKGQENAWKLSQQLMPLHKGRGMELVVGGLVGHWMASIWVTKRVGADVIMSIFLLCDFRFHELHDC